MFFTDTTNGCACTAFGSEVVQSKHLSLGPYCNACIVFVELLHQCRQQHRRSKKLCHGGVNGLSPLGGVYCERDISPCKPRRPLLFLVPQGLQPLDSLRVLRRHKTEEGVELGFEGVDGGKVSFPRRWAGPWTRGRVCVLADGAA